MRFIRSNDTKTWLWLAAGLILTVGTGCRFNPFTPRVESTGQEFEAASAAYLEGRFQEAERGFSALQHSSKRNEAAYWRGLCLLELDQPQQAREQLKKAGTRIQDPALRAQARKGIARSYALQGRYADAIRDYKQLIQDLSGNVDEAELLAATADCFEKLGDHQNAAQIRRTLAQRYPQSPYARSVPEANIVRGAPSFTVQAGAFRDQDKANMLQNTLRNKGIEVFVARRIVDGSALYIVQAGAFSTRESAEQRVLQLQRHGVRAVVKQNN